MKSWRVTATSLSVRNSAIPLVALLAAGALALPGCSDDSDSSPPPGQNQIDAGFDDGAAGAGGAGGGQHDGGANTPPNAQDDQSSTTENIPVTIDVLANDSDPDGDALQVSSTTKPAHGSCEVLPDGKVKYMPAVGYTGTDSFDYTITDSHGGEATASVSVQIGSTGSSYYVSLQGDDSNDGAASSPFRSLEAARDAIRKLTSLPDGGVTVWIREGVYERDKSFDLGKDDSGTKDKPIVYRSIPGETVRIVGAKRLDSKGWHKLDSSDPGWDRIDSSVRDKVYVMDVSKVASDFGHLSERGMGGWSGTVAHAELFCNGKPMQLARWPDASDKEPFARIDKALSDTRFTYKGDRPKRWSHAKEVWFHGYWKHMWADRYAKATKIDTGSRTITLSSKPGYGIADGQPYYAVGLLEEISVPGEWYLDADAARLYFFPPVDLSDPKTEVFLSVLGKPVVSMKSAAWVRWSGISLEMGRDYLVKIEDSSHIRIDHAKILGAGRAGVRIDGGEDVGVERCEIGWPGEDGVRLSAGDRRKIQAAKHFVRNCHIHHFSRWVWTYTPAVRMAGVGNFVEHNLMEEAPHTAILFSGNEHKIRFNHIRSVLHWSSDAGAIYTGRDWGYRNNLVEFNYIHDVDSTFEGYGTHGIYLDDCVSGITVKGNVLYKISGNGILEGGGRDNTIVNNVIVKCGVGLSADSRGIKRVVHDGSSWDLLHRLNVVHYKEEPWKSAYPRVYAIPNDWNVLKDPKNTWLYPEGCIFSRNIGFQNGKWIREINYGGTGSINKFKEVKDNIEDKDPHFVDEAHGDLSLADDSPAYSIPGFEKIPFHEIGIEPE